jgi:hypothetical protein
VVDVEEEGDGAKVLEEVLRLGKKEAASSCSL